MVKQIAKPSGLASFVGQKFGKRIYTYIVLWLNFRKMYSILYRKLQKGAIVT